MSSGRRYVFGPVRSRRLGRSLGVDPVPLKTCNWNCVYCQLGRTRPVTNERKAWTPVEAVLDELRGELRRLGRRSVDHVTIVGSGEPTLHSELGALVHGAVAIAAPVPVAVITNGASLWLPEVRRDLMHAQVVMPSLDAGSPALYRRIARGHPDLTFERLVAGQAAFCAEFDGLVWLEVMLVRGLNDGVDALRDLARVVRRIGPDEVHLNVPDRPPAEPWVEPPDDEGLMRARAILGDVARVVTPVPTALDLAAEADPVDAVVGVITRHPVADVDLVGVLSEQLDGRVDDVLVALREGGRAKLVTRHGTRFWVGAGTVHP